MYKRTSIRWKILLLIFGLLIPLNLTDPFLGRNLLKNMRDKIIQDRHTTVSMYGNQVRGQLDILRDYIAQTAVDSYWVGIGGNKKETDYELAKTRLYFQLEKMRKVLFAEAIFAQMHNTGEYMKVRVMDSLSYEDSWTIDQWLSKGQVKKGEWALITIGEKNYLCISFTGGVFTLGSLLSTNAIAETWDAANGDF